MSNNNENFTKWLHDKLNELQTDADIFGNYISGILTEDETREEKAEALQELLNEIIENDLHKIVTDILDKWEEYADKKISSADNAKRRSIDVEVQLAKLLEAQKIKAIMPERIYTEEERRIKEQILAQYAQTEIKEEEDFENGTDEAVEQQASSSGLERNTNKEDVIQLQKEKREQARLDSAAKKLKDKEDRDKQRQLREDKKEKRKTVKGERRR